MKLKIFIILAFFTQYLMGAQTNKVLDEKDLREGVLVHAACGQCLWSMEGDGCDLAVEINGGHYFVTGTGIDDHGDAHAEDGFCNSIRTVKIVGELKDGKFHAETFTLQKVADREDL